MMMQRGRTLLKTAICVAAIGALSACSMFGGGNESPAQAGNSSGGLFGGGDAEQPGIGVNAFLWRASLDTLSFMPLASADPFGGVIITDWHSDAATPNERFKATVYILDSRLRADALNVSIFRQENGPTGWQDAAVNPDTAIQIENAILRRARELRLSTVQDD